MLGQQKKPAEEVDLFSGLLIPACDSLHRQGTEFSTPKRSFGLRFSFFEDFFQVFRKSLAKQGE